MLLHLILIFILPAFNVVCLSLVFVRKTKQHTIPISPPSAIVVYPPEDMVLYPATEKILRQRRIRLAQEERLKKLEGSGETNRSSEIINGTGYYQHKYIIKECLRHVRKDITVDQHRHTYR